jgi:hypothetical protein
MKKYKTFRLPKINVSEKYQPYKNVSLDRNHPDAIELEDREKLRKKWFKIELTTSAICIVFIIAMTFLGYFKII